MMSKFKCILFLFYSIILSNPVFSQKEDNIWPLGSNGASTIDRMLADSIEKKFWPFDFNFTVDPMKIEYKLFRKSNPAGCFSSICDENGNLFCYSHGRSIFKGDDDFALNGDTIGYDQFWENNNFDKFNKGFRIFQGTLILPYPGYTDSVVYISPKFDAEKDIATGIYWGIIKGYNGGSPPTVVSKDNVIDHGHLINGMVKAVRHCNGRDWWVILISGDNTTYFIYLLDPKGLQLTNTQKLGRKQTGFSSGNATFSYQGDRYATFDGRVDDAKGIISIYNFNRCTGRLSSGHHIEMHIQRYSLGQSVSFSPNGKYLYANNDSTLYQIDLAKSDYSFETIANYEYFQSLPNASGFYQTPFGFWAEGPDGRHYNVSGAGSALHMHVMDYPNEVGKACNFRQHAIRIHNNPWTIPNFPHYRLGPLDGSPCDTLGLDNHPIAKYRYEADSIDYLRLRFTDLSFFRPETWIWDFGDGSPKINKQSPYHTFSQSGTYNVCLTVSNENSSNTLCRTITLGTSSSDEEPVSRADISLFPNPVQDFLLVTLGEYVPAYGQIMIYDINGRPVLTQRIYYGQNSVDMSGLPAGMYVWKVMDGKVEIKEGKVVKIND